MKKVAFYTLGCKLNYSETSTISRLFEQNGYQKVEFGEPTDIYVINTCSVTENADKKCRKVVKEGLKISPNAYVVVIGCYAQLKPEEIATIPGVDAVLGAAEKFRLFEYLNEWQKQGKAHIFRSDIEKTTAYHSSYSLSDRTRTFLKVQDGCDYPCTYCTIPLARGKSRSDSISNVVAQAHKIAAEGVKEIVLTGVNIGDFGIEHGRRNSRFLDLIKALDEVEGIERFRISSIEPNLLSDEIIEFVAQSKHFVPHFHIPLQSGSDKILKLMRRRYLSDLYAERVAKIKSVMPHCCIGVDVIVGFPGETHDDFLETYNFLNQLDISYLHVFTYSERANTPAATMPGKVSTADKAERSTMLHILSDKKRRFFYEQHLNTTHTVLFEATPENGLMHGFTANYIKVAAKYDPLRVNELVKGTIVGFDENGLANIVEPEELLIHTPA
jgi:threonylcarbamoyladenosine tRNA methylthiotransferase MtaB